MGWFIFIAFICFLIVLGVVLGKDPIKFTIGTLVVLMALAFVVIAFYVLKSVL